MGGMPPKFRPTTERQSIDEGKKRNGHGGPRNSCVFVFQESMLQFKTTLATYFIKVKVIQCRYTVKNRTLLCPKNRKSKPSAREERALYINNPAQKYGGYSFTNTVSGSGNPPVLTTSGKLTLTCWKSGRR